MSRLSKDSTPVLRATAISGEPTVLLPLPFVRTREGTLRNTMPAELMAPVISLPNGGIPASLGVLRRRSSLLMSLRLRTPLPILLVHMDAS